MTALGALRIFGHHALEKLCHAVQSGIFRVTDILPVVVTSLQ